MLILDFSSSSFHLSGLKPSNSFEADVISFLENWFDPTDFMMAQTSGSTGTPKPIRLTKQNMRKSAQMTCKYLRLQKGDIALLAMPVNYIAGKLMLVRAAEIGLKLICVEPTAHLHWSTFEEVTDTIDFTALTPMQVETSIDFVSHCKKVIIGGAPLSDYVKELLYPMSNEVYETYAMTETITHIAFKQVRNLQYQTVKQYFEAFDEVNIKQDERGCLVIETPFDDLEVMTNDIVELIGEKGFQWIGRVDNVINSGGIKLYPEQIEELLKPFIPGSFIITSKPDERLGNRLVLVIEGEAKEIDLSEAPLTKYQQPKEVIFAPQFPRTESGKIQRNKILL